jgi:hypothetical protein
MTKFQLSLHANKLKKGFLWRTPMPYAVVSLENETSKQPSSHSQDQQQQPQVLGKTEQCEPTLSPDWCKCIVMEYTPEDVMQRVPFVVAIYDGNDDRLITQANFEASQVFGSPGHMQMKEDPKNGTQ